MTQVPFSLDALLDLAEQYFTLRGHKTRGDLRVEPMPGGASLRRFFRVECTTSTGATASAVGMFFPDSAPEEVTSGGPTARWPFLEVLQLLSERGVRVPALYAENCACGWILVEDLGDVTLAAALEMDPASKETLYQLATRDLARAQLRLAGLPAACVVNQRRFTFDLLLWELNHFREYGLEARGIALSEAQQTRFKRAAEHLAQRVAELEYGFVHRDYQSRNLMVTHAQNGSPQLAWVDFQDALLGPVVYDLVALLNDSYQTFSPEFVAQRLREFAAARNLSARAAEQLAQEFDLVTVQRKLKDAGRFVFIERNKGDASYLQFVEPTLIKVRAALQRLHADPRIADLEQLLRELLD